MLENGADLRVNERQKIRHYRARSTEERRRIRKKKNAKSLFLLRVSRDTWTRGAAYGCPSWDNPGMPGYLGILGYLDKGGIWLDILG